MFKFYTVVLQAFGKEKVKWAFQNYRNRRDHDDQTVMDKRSKKKRGEAAAEASASAGSAPTRAPKQFGFEKYAPEERPVGETEETIGAHIVVSVILTFPLRKDTSYFRVTY